MAPGSKIPTLRAPSIDSIVAYPSGGKEALPLSKMMKEK